MITTITPGIFSKNEVLTDEEFYRFTEKKKIVIYVPGEYADKLLTEMSKAGAGKIGDYEMCSFRIQGTGTFKPGIKAKPFKGQRKKISYEEELRFEMECDNKNLNRVLDTMLKHHPYEETAYEIFDFSRREKKSSGKIITLKNKISYPDLLKKLNKKIEDTGMKAGADDEISINKMAFTNITADVNLVKSAKTVGCHCLVTVLKNNFKLYKIS